MAEEQSWTRKEYETWDEAFRGLAPAVRQQSVRVAAYTQVLFIQACADSFCADTKEGAERINGAYADLSYKCGLYHQLGKALVPPEYQLWRDNFSEEEKAVYRKYTTDGRLLVASLQERSGRARDKRKDGLAETPTKNIPWLMLRESCGQHMERWNGDGYPEHRRGKKISPIAQIVGIAKELDMLASQNRSETPFEEAYEALIAQSGAEWSPALIEVLKGAREKCFAVYNKYIHYTKALPKTIPLVEKRKDRPMGLTYRPMVNGEGKVAAYEAKAWFGGVLDSPNETESADKLAELLQRTELVGDVSFYFLYEAADAVLRIENCGLRLRGVLLEMMPEFYRLESQTDRFGQLFEDQPITREKLFLTVPAEVLEKADKNVRVIIEGYLKNHIQLVVDNYRPDRLSPEKLKQMGFVYMRLAPELYLRDKTASAMKKLLSDGFILLGGGADTHDTLAWLGNCGVSFMSGTLTGRPVSEEEMIRDSLEREKLWDA